MNRLARGLLAFLLALVSIAPISAQPSSETAGLVLQTVDGEMSTAFVMHHRPFVLPDHLTPAFQFDSVSGDPVPVDDARNALQRFLALRNLSPGQIATAMVRFDAPEVQQIIPEPNLRAALLMLTDWDPYQTTIGAILDGANETGRPFDLVDFRPLDFGSAIATLQVAYSTGNPRMLVSDRYRNEAPAQLIPILVHESMHDGVDNSFEEELIASLLDCLTYAEVLAVDPDAANTGSELAAFNNVQLVAMMNSIGRRGAGYVGIETSFDGDVYLGPGLESFDADSIRAGISSDPWYAQLPTGGSNGGAVLRALLGRFPESAALGSLDRFSTEAIEVIDRGIGLVLSPRTVHALAIDLQLSLVERDAAPAAIGNAQPTLDNFADRPFLPVVPARFDLRSMQPSPTPFDAEFSRASLRGTLLRAGRSPSDVATVLAEFDDPSIAELAPDPTLRAALLMLRLDPRWEPVLSSIIDGINGTGFPVHVAFRDLPRAVPAVWENQGWQGAPVIWVHSMLVGDSPELLATAILEGALLESDHAGTAQATVAAALASVLWADLLSGDPDLSHPSTWGTITRNRDLLALLNSQPFDAGTPDATGIGLRLGTGSGDVLPGLTPNPASFAAYILNSPRRVPATPSVPEPAPVSLTEFLRIVDVLRVGALPGGFDDTLLARIDLEFGRIISPATAVRAATALELTIEAPDFPRSLRLIGPSPVSRVLGSGT